MQRLRKLVSYQTELGSSYLFWKIIRNNPLLEDVFQKWLRRTRGLRRYDMFTVILILMLNDIATFTKNIPILGGLFPSSIGRFGMALEAGNGSPSTNAVPLLTTVILIP